MTPTVALSIYIEAYENLSIWKLMALIKIPSASDVTADDKLNNYTKTPAMDDYASADRILLLLFRRYLSFSAAIRSQRMNV